MSQEDAKRLIRRMDADEPFREKVLAAHDVAARLRLAAAEGYEVAPEEIAGAEGRCAMRSSGTSPEATPCRAGG